MHITCMNSTSVEEHVSDNCRSLVDLIRMSTEDDSLAGHSLGLHSVQGSRGNQHCPLSSSYNTETP